MSKSPKEPLDQLYESVGAAEDVNWGEASESLAKQEEQEALEALQLIAEIQQAHRDGSLAVGDSSEGLFVSRAPEELSRDSPRATDRPSREEDRGSKVSWGTLELRDKIGEGASAEVFRAWDSRLEREGALKLLRPTPSAANPHLDAVLREARLLVRVASPNTVRVHSVEEHDGRIGIWMELIPGKTLHAVVREQGPLSAREAALIGIDLCRALAAVHSKGILHRDVKAQNVMREVGGRIVLMDFGIGQDTQKDGLVESSGTPLYLAPEILEGAPATDGSDLYALGVLLFFLVTGSYPVLGASIDSLKRAHEEGRRQLLRDLRPDLPREFVEVVERAVAAKPGDRFKSAGEMEGALEWIFPGSGQFRTRAEPEPGRRRRRFSKPKLMSAIAATLLATFFAVLRLYPQDSVSRALIQKAESERFQGDLSQAGWWAKKALLLEPDDPWALLPLEISARAEGDFALALDLAQQAFENRDVYLPSLPKQVMKTEARWALNLGDLRLFEDLMKGVLDEDSEDRDGDRWLTLAALLRADYDAARGHGEKAKKLSRPDDPVGQGQVALVLAQGGDGAAALDELKAVRFDWKGPDPPYFDWLRGFAFLVDGKLPEAEAGFDALAEGGAVDRSNARFFRAQTQVLAGRLQEAMDGLRAAAGADGDRGFSGARNRKLLLLYELHLLLGEQRAARSVLSKLSQPKKLFPAEAADLREVGVALARSGAEDQALEIQEKLVELAEDVGALQRTGNLGEKNRSASRVLLRLAEQIHAEVFLENGDLESATGKIHTALEGSWDTSLLATAGRILKAAGRYQEALSYFEEIDRRKGLVFHDHPATWWLLAQLDLAECRAETGEAQAVEETLAVFLHFWKNSLEQLPELARRVELLRDELDSFQAEPP